MLTNAHISCIYFFLIGLIVYEIRQVATLPAWPHYPSFPYICISNCVLILLSNNYICICATSTTNNIYFLIKTHY